MKMMFRKIFRILDASNCKEIDNIKKVIRILSEKKEDFFIFFVNITIDFRINSLDDSYLADFFEKYSSIDVTAPPDKIAKDLHFQIQNYFIGLMLNCNIRFTPDEWHINVIPYDTFYKEHLPVELNISLDDFYDNYDYYISFINDIIDGVASLRVPYRKATLPSGTIQKRIAWLAKYNEIFKLANSHSKDLATAINDILGLGFEDTSRPANKTLLFYLIYSDSFKQECSKPTFIEGPLWNYENSFFLNSISNNGYGLTRSTDKGLYEASECVTDSLNSLPSDFQLDSFGYAEAIVDKTNMKNNALKRLNET